MMGIFDKLKGVKADEIVDKAKEQLAGRGEQIDQAIDKVADLADQASDRKFSDKIDSAAEKLKDAADRLDDER